MTIRGAPQEDWSRFDDEPREYDAVLVMSFGGPEGMDDVMPFLEKVVRGRRVPRERLTEVAQHYEHFGGVSPLNTQNRALCSALRAELQSRGPDLPVYLGNRNWHPFVTDVLREMRDDGVRRAIAFVTSAFSVYSGCRQYREDILSAAAALGSDAPEIDKIRCFYNHPGFIEPNVRNLVTGLASIPEGRRADAHVAFTAHSVPLTMARASDYEAQLADACAVVAAAAGAPNVVQVYQSRSGPPRIPWLGPDILDYLERVHEQGGQDVVVVPIGFVSDHMEVLYDLDTEAKAKAEALGLNLVRVPTVGTAADFVAMIRDLIVERMTARPTRPALGTRGPNHDICPVACCQSGVPDGHSSP